MTATRLLLMSVYLQEYVANRKQRHYADECNRVHPSQIVDVRIGGDHQ